MAQANSSTVLKTWTNRFLYLILTVTFLGSVFLRFSPIEQVGFDDDDATRYHLSARSMFESGQFAAKDWLHWGKPFAIYSYLLSFHLFGDKDTSIFWLNAILDTLILGFLVAIGLRLAGPAGGLVFTFMYGLNFYPVSLALEGLAHTPAFAYFCFFAGLFILSNNTQKKWLSFVFLFFLAPFHRFQFLLTAVC